MALIILLEGKLLIIILILESLGATLLANKLNDKVIRIIANIIFAIIIIWMINRVVLTEARGLAIVNRRTLFDLFIVVFGILFSLINKVNFINYFYRIFFGQLVIFFLLWRDLDLFSYELLLGVFIFINIIIKSVALKVNDRALEVSSDFIFYLLTSVIFFRIIIMISLQVLSSAFISGTAFLNVVAIIDIFFIIAILAISFFLTTKRSSIFFKIISVVLSFGVLFRELVILDYNYVLISWFILLAIIFSLAKKYIYLKPVANFFFILLTSWIAGRILLQSSGYPLLNISSIVNLIFIVLIVLLAKFIVVRKQEVYYMIANFLLVGFLFRELYYFGYFAIIIVWLLDSLIVYFLATKRKMNYLKFQSYLIFSGSSLLIIFKVFKLIFN